MKKTAVEWLLDEIYGQGILDGVEQYCHNTLEQLYKQAKEMEKEQIIDAYINGIHLNLLLSDCMSHEDIVEYANKYYNETFNKSNK